MNKSKVIYFRKTHKLLINSILIQNTLHLHYTTASNANSESVLATTLIQPPKIIDIVSVDILQPGKQALDSEVTFNIYLRQSNVKSLKVTVLFDLSRQKILSPNSQQFFKKAIKGNEFQGLIQYKFIGLSTAEISEEIYQDSLKNRNEIELTEKIKETDQQYKRLHTIVEEKDKLIKTLSEKIQFLTNQTKRLSIDLRDNSVSKDANYGKNAISLNINVKPLQKIDNQCRILTRENQNLKKKMFKMSEAIQRLEGEKKNSERQIERLDQQLRKSKRQAKELERKAGKEGSDKFFNRQSSNSSFDDRKRTSQLGQYSMLKKKIEAEDKQFKNQIQQAGKFDDLTTDKDLLLHKLKGSIKQIESLQSEIQNMHFYITKLTDQLKILRNNNSKEGILAKIEAIRTENQKAIQELVDSSDNATYQKLFLRQKEKFLTEIVLLKHRIEELQAMKNQIQGKLNYKCKQYQGRISRYKTKQIQIMKEKEVYKVQLEESRASLQKMHKSRPLANRTELASSIIFGSQAKDSFLKKLSKQDSSSQNHPKQRKLDEILRLKSEEADKLKKSESMSKIMNQKLEHCKNQIEQYQRMYNKLKSYVASISSTLMKKNQFGSDEKYEEQLVSNINKFEQQMRKAEDQYYSHQIKSLKEQKQRLIEYYYSEIANAKKKIDQDDKLSSEEKKILKQSKEIEFQKQKKYKLQQMEQRIKKAELKYDEFKQNQKIKRMTIPERVANIEKKVKLTIDEKQKLRQQNQKLNQSVNKLKESIKLKESGQILNSSLFRSGTLVGNNIQEIRNKYIEEWSKMNEQTRKQMKTTLEDNNKLRIQVGEISTAAERMRVEKERTINTMIRQNKQKESNFEYARLNWKQEKTILQKKIESLDTQLAKYKQQNQSLEDAIKLIQKDHTILNDQYNKKIQQNGQHQVLIKNLRQQLDDYSKVSQKLLQQIQQLSKLNQQQKAQFQKLLQQRSIAFMHIEQIRKTEISNLTRIRQQFEFRLQEQIDEALKIKGNNSQLFEFNTSLTNKIKEYEQQNVILKQNYSRQKQELEQKIKMYEQLNQQLEKHLMNLAEDYNKIQQEFAKSNIQKQGLSNQLQFFKKLQDTIKQLETSKKAEREELQYVILDKKQQIKNLQNKFLIFQEQLKFISDQSQKMKGQFQTKQATIAQLQQRIDQKSLEVIKYAQEKSILNITLTRKEVQIQDLAKKLNQTSLDVRNMKAQNEELKESINKSQTYIEQMQKNIKQHQKQHQLRKKVKQSREQLFVPESGSGHSNAMQEIQHIKSIKNSPQASRVKELSEHFSNHNSQKKPKVLIRQQVESIEGEFSQPQYQDYFESSPELNFLQADTHELNQRKLELYRQIGELQSQKDGLLKQMNDFKEQLDKINHSRIRSVGQPINIKINEVSIEENTNEATFSQQHHSLQHEMQKNSRVKTQLHKLHQEELTELQLMISQLNNEKRILEEQLEEQKVNNENLLKAEQELDKFHEDYKAKINELQAQNQQIRSQFHHFKTQYQTKIQEILAELMQKENDLTNTLQQLQNAQEKLYNCQLDINNLQQAKEEKEQYQEHLKDNINKLRVQFCKYEQQAELQILMLKQKFDEVITISKQKDDQLIQLAQKYLSLQQGTKFQQQCLDKVQKDLENAVKQNIRLEEESKRIQTQNQQFNQTRNKLLKKIHELELALVNKHQQITQANQNASLAIVKTNIKISNMTQQLEDMKKRQQQKQKTILTLKNQISLYNDECFELKKSNQQLDYQLQRVTKELKDIMLNYQSQFQQLNMRSKKTEQNFQSLEALLKQKQKSSGHFSKQVRQLQRQKLKAQQQLHDIKANFQRHKLLKQRQLNQKTNQIEIKINDLERLKVTYNKLLQQSVGFQAKLQEQKQKYQSLLSNYKLKMNKYEQSIEELSKDIQGQAARPSKQAWEQLNFENTLFKNRIQELEDQLKSKQRQNNFNSTENKIQIEFRKFKANKEAVIKNLQQQLETYSSKKNEVEQANYYLKRQNDSLRHQLQKFNEQNQQLHQELKNMEQDLAEMKEQVEFYKQKRRVGLTKLLNDTDD